MTRINLGIPVQELTREHLIAEHREIKRIPNAIRTGKAVVKDIPEQFRLGTGHVKFFYDKLGYLRERYEQIYQECLARGYDVTYYGAAWDDIPESLLGSYEPTESDVAAVRARIQEKLTQSKRKKDDKSKN